VDDHDAGSSVGANRGPKQEDLEITEYLEFILLHSMKKDPLTVWTTLSKRLLIVPMIVRRLFSYLLIFQMSRDCSGYFVIRKKYVFSERY